MLLNSIAFLLPLLAIALSAPAADDQPHRLIKLSADKPAEWMTDAEVGDLHKKNINFMDITYTPSLEKGVARRFQPGKARLDAEVPAEPTQVELVRALIATAKKSNMQENLIPFTEFHNRYYKAGYGTESSNWWYERVQKVVNEANTKGLKVTVSQFKHKNWPQSSTIARIEGMNDNQEMVIMGAHQDSINGANPMEGRAPGADDDGSGCVTQLEILRVLLSNGYQPKRPIEFQWYSAEEDGLLGSQDIAQTYKNAGKIVAAMMQLDMTGYPEAQPDMGVQADFTNPELTRLLHGVIRTYAKYNSKEYVCGYACTDHASFFRAGYPTARPAESSVRPLPNKNTHSPKDTLQTISYDHMIEFVKVGLGFVVELSHA